MTDGGWVPLRRACRGQCHLRRRARIAELNALTVVAAETALARAAKDCACVAPLVEAGAIIVGKTNNPEFCYHGVTSNDL